MAIRFLSSPGDLERYDKWVTIDPQGNLWQSLERRAYCQARGKEVRLYAVEEGGRFVATAQVVIDRTSFGLSAWDIPHGPLWLEREKTAAQTLLRRILDDARSAGALCLFYSPYTPLSPDGWVAMPSGRLVYAQATRIVDLQPSHEEVLARMHEKGRYNIKVAQKHGVEVRESKDSDLWYGLVRATARRDGFRHPSKEHYRTFLDHLPGSYLMLAYPKGSSEPIAGLFGVIWRTEGIYYYGASSYAHRNLMAPYLLQWESMRYCKAHGCLSYDLLGIVPPLASPTHPWQGISAFKAKFGGMVTTHGPEEQVTLRPLVHTLLRWKRSLF